MDLENAGPHPLINSGSICWCNALVQSLLACKHIRAAIRDKSHERSDSVGLEDTSGREALIFNLIIDFFMKPPNSNSGAEFAAILHQINPHLNGQQQCAYEGFTTFVDGAPKFIGDLFRAYYNKHFICSLCGKESDELDVVSGITIPETVTNSAQIQRFIYAHIDRSVEKCCERCSPTKSVIHSLQYELHNAPKVIAIISEKYSTTKPQVDFPQELQFLGENSAFIQFRLFALIEHSGSKFGGHYWAKIAKRASGETRVFCANDSSIVPEGSTLIPKPESYIAFYQ
ncbi:MAG: ubiquitin carboxyl-terminal hydrolase [Methylomonas sp.]|jgi:ubiquitin C-terminal hydrolase|uniref:hypothetical protein n=1 Tax=Methylomonas sp. TaxID=418 RepID=UPI0025D550A0|nr:hypothetical protein [Methylomonas sp.]MCK9607503.1 ubiquitin carboxyl-terminal hydrolase [Methylomonas sp.]